MGTAIFERLCEQRGLSDDFIHPKYEKLADPYVLPGMKEAVERICVAADRGERVLIYGDYDVDGVTASATMYDILKLVGIKEVGVMLPNRLKDGYGMNMRVVERAIKSGFTLVVTVDCGSRNFEVIEKLREAGVDVVVTDHHECEERLPAAVAVVNPKRKDFDGGAPKGGAVPDEGVKRLLNLKDLAGVGVAFEVARALVKAGRIPNGQEKWLLDLVMLGTLCDSMKISQENRILTYYGAKVLKKTRRPGLIELLRVGHVEKVTAEAVNFRLGPMLNAAGRLETATLALRLLMTKDVLEAAKLATQLDGLNGKRRRLQMEAMDEIRAQGVGEEPVIVVSGKWHEGVLGIIAGRLVEEYRRPAFAFAKVDVDGDGIVDTVYKGSGRSFGDFNLAQALCECQNEVIAGGGHAEACGLRVATDKMSEFCCALNRYYKSLNLKNQERFLEEKADIVVRPEEMREVSTELAEELAQLEPFGVGNEEPLVKLENMTVSDVRKMGADKQHLALEVAGDDPDAAVRNIAFGAPEAWMKAKVGDVVDAWVRLAVNEFRGTRNVEGRLERLEQAKWGL